jgi:hypothetical protein
MPTEDGPDEPFGAEVVREMHESRLNAARTHYEAIVNRLWAGCAGGLISVASILRHPSDWAFWLSVASFFFGVLLLGVGALLTLVSARTVIRHLENIQGILEMRTDYAERQSNQAGLSMRHPQTWTALTAAGLFVLGVISAGILVWRHQ